MLHACAARFDVTGNLEKFCELNKALIADLRIPKESVAHKAATLKSPNPYLIPSLWRSPIIQPAMGTKVYRLHPWAI